MIGAGQSKSADSPMRYECCGFFYFLLNVCLWVWFGFHGMDMDGTKENEYGTVRAQGNIKEVLDRARPVSMHGKDGEAYDCRLLFPFVVSTEGLLIRMRLQCMVREEGPRNAIICLC